MRTALSTLSISPLPMTGMRTACFTCRMQSKSTGGAYICCLVRPWMQTADAPAASALLANSTAFTLSPSQPLRNLTVTGTGTARTTARMIASARSGFFISALPAPPEVILGAGQPMLISRMSGEKSMQRRAAPAITAGSSPNICTAIGRSAPVTSSSSLVLRSDIVSPLALAISPMT